MGKYFFEVNLPLNLFRVTVANADIGSIKSLHTFLKKKKKNLYHMLVKFEQIVWPELHKVLGFWQKSGFLKPFLIKRWRNF